MSEVLIFVLGALFCLTLVVAVAAMFGQPAAAQGFVLHDPQPMAQPLQYRPAARPAATQKSPQPSGAAADIAGRVWLDPRAHENAARKLESARRAVAVADAYQQVSNRQDRQLQRVRLALSRIAAGAETAAAKIAGQTLRRIDTANETARDRLTFACARLELLSLGQDPRARKEALMALADLA